MKPVYNQGIHLSETILWMDAYHPKDMCFISHAHVETGVSHHKVVATHATIRLYKKTVKGSNSRIRGLVCPYNRPFALGQLEIELFPAGHILGSAQVKVTLGKENLVYNGGFSLQRKLTCEPIEITPCQQLVIPAHYADERFSFPPLEESYARLTDEVTRALDSKTIPVIFAPVLGTAQEVIKLLGDAGLKTRAHRSIYDKVKAYHELGVNFENCKCFRGTPRPDEVIVWPPHLRSSSAIKKLKRTKTILLGGQVVVPGVVERYKVDLGLPISDSADFAETMALIERSGAKKVYVFDGYAISFAETLRKRGIDAESLTNNQFSLKI